MEKEEWRWGSGGVEKGWMGTKDNEGEEDDGEGKRRKRRRKEGEKRERRKERERESERSASESDGLLVMEPVRKGKNELACICKNKRQNCKQTWSSCHPCVDKEGKVHKFMYHHHPSSFLSFFFSLVCP